MKRRGLSMFLSFVIVSSSIGLVFPGRAYAVENESAGAAVRKDEAKVLLAVDQYDESGEMVRMVHFDYDENGRISRSYHDDYWNGSPRDDGYDYIYTYDEAGRLLSRYFYVDLWDSGFEDVIRSYDSNGSLVSDHMYSEGEISVEREYAYDQDGRVIWEHAVNGSPFLGGRVENEYSYSYHTDAQGRTVGIRHNETDPSAEDTEVIYNADGQMIQGHKSEMGSGIEGKVKYEYLDDPYFCVRDESFVYSYGGVETRSSSRYAIIQDGAGQEIESFMLGSPEQVKMSYDENGCLVRAENISDEFYTKCEFIYGRPGEGPETPPLAYEDQTEHQELTTSPEDMSSILTQEEAYARAVAGSEYEDGETQTINGTEFVVQFWDCGRAGYNGRSVYVYQVRRLRKIDGPQMTQLLETVLVDALTGECTVMSPAEPWALEDDPLSNDSAGGNTPAPENERPDQEQHPILTVIGDAVNVRSGPDTSYKSLGSVNRGDKLFSTGKSGNWYQVEYSGGKGSRGTTLTITGKSDNWYQVDYNGKTGYIIEDYVIKNR